jgi:hypothetical protein
VGVATCASRGVSPQGLRRSEGAGAEALRPSCFGQPCHGGAMLRMEARARHLQAEGADTYASVPLVPPGGIGAGLTSFAGQRAAALHKLRREPASAVRDGLPCVSSWRSHASHGRRRRTASLRLAQDLRRAVPRDDIANGATPPHLDTTPRPASDAQACRVPRGRDRRSLWG